MTPRNSSFFLLVFSLFVHTVSAQFTQGTLVFKEEVNPDWTAFDAKLAENLNEIEASDNTADEKERQKAEWRNFSDNMISMLKEKVALSANDSTVYVFTENQAVALRTEEEKLRTEFFSYNFDSLQMIIHTIKGGKPYKRIISSTPKSAAVNWRNVRDSVVIDSSDAKNILGFKCIKYYLFHSHLLKGQTEPTEFHYELYVTDAIKFPFYVFDPAITSPVFSGCALEIRYADPQAAPINNVKRAVSFSPKIDASQLVLPEKFKE